MVCITADESISNKEVAVIYPPSSNACQLFEKFGKSNLVVDTYSQDKDRGMHLSKRCSPYTLKLFEINKLYWQSQSVIHVSLWPSCQDFGKQFSFWKAIQATSWVSWYYILAVFCLRIQETQDLGKKSKMFKIFFKILTKWTVQAPKNSFKSLLCCIFSLQHCISKIVNFSNAGNV